MYARTEKKVVDLNNYHRVDYLYDKPYSENNTGTLIYPQHIIKHSEKLEDLIDEYVSVDDKGNHYMSKYPIDKCYGAIWTTGAKDEPILKSVAEIKDGKLVLL